MKAFDPGSPVKLGKDLMRKLQSVFAAAAAVLLMTSCAAPTRMLPVPPLTELMKTRAEEFRASLAADPIRGTILSENDLMFFAGRPVLLTERLALLGMNRIYVMADSTAIFENESGAALEELVYAAANQKIGVEVVFPQGKFVQMRSGNVFQRKYGEERPLFAAAEAARKFNDSLEDDAKLAGVGVIAEMHTFTLASPELPSNALYLWGDKSYGIGHDNDVLMQQMLVDFAHFRKLAGPDLPLTLAIPAFYHERAVAGDLSCGKVADFLAIADRVAVIGYGSRPTEFLESVTSELASAGSEKRLLIGVNVAGHTSAHSAELRRRDWNDMAKIAAFLAGRARRYPAFDGLVLGPYKTLELLWEM